MFTDGTEKQIAYADSIMQKEINEADKAIAIIAGETKRTDIEPGEETAGELSGKRIVARWEEVRKYLPDDFGDKLIERAEEIIAEYKDEYSSLPASEYLDIRVRNLPYGYGKTTEETLPLVQILENRLGAHGDFQEEYEKAEAKKPRMKSHLDFLRKKYKIEK